MFPYTGSDREPMSALPMSVMECQPCHSTDKRDQAQQCHLRQKQLFFQRGKQTPKEVLKSGLWNFAWTAVNTHEAMNTQSLHVL